MQAVPGNGKTTLLAAKIALLSRNWTSRAQGVCVISHTNAARHEVEKELLNHATASAFLSYPHFIGTVTGFVNKYIALPYLRGLGWGIQQIDDDAFEALIKNGFVMTRQSVIEMLNETEERELPDWFGRAMSDDMKNQIPKRLKEKFPKFFGCSLSLTASN